MKPDPIDEARRWLAQGREDLEAAREVMGHKRYYLACFLAQQVAEKALKAYLYGRGEDLVFGHSVGELCDWAARYDAGFKALKQKIAMLDRYYVAARYPNGVAPGAVPAEVFNQEDATQAVGFAELAVSRVSELLKLSGA